MEVNPVVTAESVCLNACVAAGLGAQETVQCVNDAVLRREDPEGIARDVYAVQQIRAVPTLLQVLCEITSMRFAAVARVTEETWTLCVAKDDIGFGLKPGGQLPVETTLCSEAKRSAAPLVVEQASLDPRYGRHPMLNLHGIESYVSVPIILASGRYFGNLCALDPAPAKISPASLGAFKHFAALIALQLDSESVRANVEISLRDERAASELREQFIAILGHDLRNPLQAIAATSELILLRAVDPLVAGMAKRIKANSHRMSSLINDVLDFARGRLGGGIGLRVAEIENIDAGLGAIVKEMQDGQPDRQIAYDFNVTCAVRCDIGRLQQVASNLLGNALTHGAPDKTVRISSCTDDHDFVLQVWNEGEPIPPENIVKVFEPFWRRESSSDRDGLGLGLYICAQILRAHGGQLSVTSSREAGTTFTARVPLHLVA